MIVEIVDDRLQLFDLRVCGLDERTGFVDLRLDRLQSRIRALQLLLALVECLVGGPAFRDQRRGASQLLIREVQLGVVASDTRLTGYKCLAGELSRRLRLVQLRHGLGRVDTGDHAPDWHDVAFVRNDLDNAPGYLRRNVDLGGLDPAVDAHDACRQGRGLVLFPGDVTRSGTADQDHHRRHNDHIAIELHGFASESATTG